MMGSHIAFLMAFAVLTAVDGFVPQQLRSHIAPIPKTPWRSNTAANSRTRMYVFDRLFRLVTSNVNSLVKRLEDPEKVIEQAVLDMQNDLVRVRQSYAEVAATQKRMEKQRQNALGEVDLWYKRAQAALAANDESLAREALARRQTQQEIASNLEKQLSVQNGALDKLYQSMQALEAKIIEAKRQKEALIARARTAKTSLEVNNMLNELTTTSSSFEAFNRMQDKVDSLETQAEIAGDMVGISSSSSIEEKFRALDGTTAIDNELALLKRNMSDKNSNNAAAALPSGEKKESRAMQSPPLSAELEAEYERLKRELRGRP